MIARQPIPQIRMASISFPAILFCFLAACGSDSDQSSGNVPPKFDLDALDDSDVSDESLIFSKSAEESPAGSYIVNFRGDWPQMSGSFPSFFAETRHFFAQLSSQFLVDRRVKSLDYLHHLDFRKVLGDHQFASEFGTPKFLQRSLGAGGDVPTLGVIAKVDFASEHEAQKALAEWHDKGLVWFAEPNYRSEPSQGSFDGYISRYSNLAGCGSGPAADYWLNEINLKGAYEELSKSRVAPVRPIIAVMDSGVDFTNDHLSGRKWPNTRVGARGCENDQAGCNTTVGKKGILGDGAIEPFNLQSDGTCPAGKGSGCDSRCCHGTHVAGIIAGYKDDGDLTVGGVCPMCEIVAIRVLGTIPGEKEGTILDSSIIRGFKYISYFSAAEGFGVRVINASFGKFQRSRSVSLLIRLLRETSNGVVVIGAAGNEDSMKPNYPAGYSDAIAVSNIHSTGPKHVSSNFGRWVDIAAPGDQICSTVPGGFEAKSGTSMASPVVAGVAGLLLAVNPSLTYSELRDRLLLTANKAIYDNEINKSYIPKLKGETAPVPLLGTGMVNAQAAVQNVQTQGLPIVGALDRVTISCGTISKSGPPQSFLLTLVFILVPLFLLAGYSLVAGRIRSSNNE